MDINFFIDMAAYAALFLLFMILRARIEKIVLRADRHEDRHERDMTYLADRLKDLSCDTENLKKWKEIHQLHLRSNEEKEKTLTFMILQIARELGWKYFGEKYETVDWYNIAPTATEVHLLTFNGLIAAKRVDGIWMYDSPIKENETILFYKLIEEEEAVNE